MSNIVLPRTGASGKPRLSYSQVKSWGELKSFNLKVLGKYEYILEKFFNEDFGDIGWALFGTEVEEYILERKHTKSFTKEERKILDAIVPLDIGQQEGTIDFGEFELLLYIDDCTKDFMHIRDYKTCSENSGKKYYGEDYWQMDVYSMWVKQQTGKLPEKAEVCMIERAGNCFRGGGRKVLTVKDRVWYHDREITEERQDELREKIVRTANEISDCYKVFLKMKEL